MDEKPQHIDEDDWSLIHYAVGLLVGVAGKYGVVDVTIYYNSIHVRIEQEVKDE